MKKSRTAIWRIKSLICIKFIPTHRERYMHILCYFIRDQLTVTNFVKTRVPKAKRAEVKTVLLSPADFN